MADGDYERGRDREIAALQSRLRALAKARATVPAVLVLNGWASSPHAWDLCSFNTRQAASTRLFSYLDQLDGSPESFIQSIPSERPLILVGWSMGGSSALRLASRFRERLAGLILLAATPRMMEEKETNWRGMNARRLEALHKGLELTHGAGFFGIPEGCPNPYQMDVTENLERGLRYLLDTDCRAELEQAFPQGTLPAFPVFIFQSEHDGIVRRENADYLKTIFPNAQLTLVSGTEHALPIRIPKEIDDAVDACLAVAQTRANPH